MTPTCSTLPSFKSPSAAKSSGPAIACGVAEDIPGHDFDDDDPDQTKTTFTDLEMVDEDGHPVPGEHFEVTDSAGKVKRGSLNQDGFAHVTGISPGVCRIAFPNLDQTVWRRALLETSA